jgi:hypothetical protein
MLRCDRIPVMLNLVSTASSEGNNLGQIGVFSREARSIPR